MSDTALVHMPHAEVLAPLASPSCAQICAALAAAQAAFRPPRRTKTAVVRTRDGGSYRFSYAPLEEIIDAVKEGLAANGISRQQYLVGKGADGPIRSGEYYVRTIIWHSSGEWLASDYPIIFSKEDAQGFAGGVTYARRYGLSLALGLAPEDDDDGNVASDQAVTVTATQPKQTRTAKTKPEPPHDPDTGEIDQRPADEQYEEIMKYDKLLEAASNGPPKPDLSAMAQLMAVWQATPPRLQHQLKSALDRRHKPNARQVDQQHYEAQHAEVHERG